MKLLLKCHHCGNQMLYEPRSSVGGKSKSCVFCGRSFVVRTAVLKQKP